jgi:hypothetical protein
MAFLEITHSLKAFLEITHSLMAFLEITHSFMAFLEITHSLIRYYQAPISQTDMFPPPSLYICVYGLGGGGREFV